MVQRVLFDLGRSTPDSRITAAKVLSYLSEARHQLQTRTTASKCLKVIDLSDPCNEDEDEYNIGCSIKGEPAAEYKSDLDDSNAKWQPINAIPWLEMEILRSGKSNQYSNYSVPTVSIFNGKLRTWPLLTTGGIRLKFIPRLPQYAPDDTTDWAGYGTEPIGRMKVEGPGDEFTDAQEGMIAFAKLKLAESFPNELNTYARLLPGWDYEWRKCFSSIKTTDVQRGRRTPSQMGVIK